MPAGGDGCPPPCLGRLFTHDDDDAAAADDVMVMMPTLYCS